MHLLDFAYCLFQAQHLRDQRLALFGRPALRAILWNLDKTRGYDVFEVGALWQLFRELEKGVSIANEKFNEI